MERNRLSRAYASPFLLVFRPTPFSSRLLRPAKPSYRVSPARIQSLPLSSLFAILCNEILTSYLRLLKISSSLVEDRCILVFSKMGTYDKKISGRIVVAKEKKKRENEEKKKERKRTLVVLEFKLQIRDVQIRRDFVFLINSLFNTSLSPLQDLPARTLKFSLFIRWHLENPSCAVSLALGASTMKTRRKSR